jgi:hypothetical protein
MANNPVIVPSNQIVFNYTIGNEYIDTSIYKDYQGHYYEFNGKIFAGKEFNINAPVLIKKDSSAFNPLLSNPLLSTYGKINVSSPNFQPEPPYINNTLEISNFNEDDLSYSAYFCSKIVDKQVLIKQISQETYNQYKNNPSYIVIEIKLSEGDVPITSTEMEIAEQQMPGFTDWFISENDSLGGELYIPSNFTL